MRACGNRAKARRERQLSGSTLDEFLRDMVRKNSLCFAGL
jgi:hypothetical protein